MKIVIIEFKTLSTEGKIVLYEDVYQKRKKKIIKALENAIEIHFIIKKWEGEI